MKNSIWMLGACGMGVGPLAIYLKESGHEVYGWDDSTGSPMENHLSNAEIPLLKDPWAAGRKPNLIGRSSAVKPGHAALTLAEKNKTRVLRRGELLAESVADKKFVAVCGSHGKTTTCGLIISALATAGIDFGYVLGGLFRDPNFPPAHASKKSPWVVAEVDESDGTISHFSPDITVAVNLDWDHPDYYKDEAALESVFRALFERTQTAVVIPSNNERLERLTRGLKARVIRVGESGDFTAKLIQADSHHSRLMLGGKFKKAEVSVPVTGAFNRANASMALAVTHLITGVVTTEPLTRWRGIRRRQDVLFERQNLLVLADYAHHPTEIAALLKWIKETHMGQLIVVFQPHRHTRTRQYASEFRQALQIADVAVVLPVYSAGEAAVEGGKSDAVVAGSALKLIENRSELPKIISPLTKDKKTIVAFVGAGDIEHDAENYALILRREGLPALTQDLGEAVAGKLSAKCIIRPSEPLARRTTLGVGGVARWYAEPATVNDIIVLLQAAGELGLPYFVLGRGSNLLVLDEGYDGLIVHLNSEHWGEVKNLGDGRLQLGGGARLKEICGVAARDGLSGFEFLEGIPGTLGGSLRMNAGAMDSWIFDRVESIDWLSPRGIHRTAKRDCFDAMYRDCPQLHGAVILSAVLKSTGKESPEKIRQTMDEMSQKRKSSQPRDPSAGCVFKNPEKNHAGRLIESAGLKGVHIGAAEVSNIHANFIINKGDATAKDILALMKQVRQKVQQEKHELLQPEIIALGKEWKDLL